MSSLSEDSSGAVQLDFTERRRAARDDVVSVQVRATRDVSGRGRLVTRVWVGSRQIEETGVFIPSPAVADKMAELFSRVASQMREARGQQAAIDAAQLAARGR